MTNWNMRTEELELKNGGTIKNYHYEFNSTDRVLAKIVEDVFKGIMDIKADRKTEPTISKMEQVEDEPQTDEEYINNLPWTEVGNGEQTENLFTDKDGDVWEWRGDAWYCISGDEPQTEDFKACVEGLTLLWIYNYVTDDEFHRIDARLKCKDEPHIVGKHADVVIIDESRLTAKCLNCNNAKACKEKHWDGCVYEPKDEKTCETCRHWKYIAHEWQCEACKCQGYEPKDEPQTERSE